MFLIIPILSFSQAEELPDPVPYFSAVIVEDIDISIEWYSEVLGFEEIDRIDSEERGFSQANLRRGDALIELIQLENSLSPQDLLEDKARGTRINGFFKFGFSVKDFDLWVDHFEKSNVEFRGVVVEDPDSGKRMVIILDPDGNRIQLFES